MDESTPLGRLMHDFRCTQADDMYYAILSERVRYLKETEEGAISMCEAMENLMNEVKAYSAAQGMAQGMENERIFSIRKLMINLHLTAEKAMDALSIPKEEQAKYKAML